MADAVQSPSSDQFTVDDLRGIALLALVIAHGADSDLDPREINTIADRLLTLERSLSGDDVIVVFRRAAEEYAAMKVVNAEKVVTDLRGVLDLPARRRAFALLRAVAEADGIMHRMESALLRHIAEDWGIGPAFVEEAPPPTAEPTLD